MFKYLHFNAKDLVSQEKASGEDLMNRNECLSCGKYAGIYRDSGICYQCATTESSSYLSREEILREL